MSLGFEQDDVLFGESCCFVGRPEEVKCCVSELWKFSPLFGNRIT